MAEAKMKDDVTCIHLEEDGPGFSCWMNGNSGKLMQMLITATGSFLSDKDYGAEESRELFNVIIRAVMGHVLKKRPEFEWTYKERTLIGLFERAIELILSEDEDDDEEETSEYEEFGNIH